MRFGEEREAIRTHLAGMGRRNKEGGGRRRKEEGGRRKKEEGGGWRIRGTQTVYHQVARHHG
jgi:hypothetical protein